MATTYPTALTAIRPRDAGKKPTIDALDFELPCELEAGEPPEARGLERDEVRLMVSYLNDDSVVHSRFRDLADYLNPGDVLVINTSGTMNAALRAVDEDGADFELHLSTRRADGTWVVEVRQLDGASTKPFYDGRSGQQFDLPGGGRATLEVPLNRGDNEAPKRLWVAQLALPDDLHTYLDQHGFPIRYSYVKQGWPGSYYQTAYATEMGSAEMPSAGRAFTPQLITRLVAKGIVFAPLILHTGVASLEDHEPPYAEYYRVPEDTAQIVNHARAAGKRVVAVGTTVVRALETVTNLDGRLRGDEGWTDVIITPERGITAVNGMLTGLHEPKATHLAMLEALAGRDHLRKTYDQALHKKYLWHEFGDLHLILP